MVFDPFPNPPGGSANRQRVRTEKSESFTGFRVTPVVQSEGNQGRLIQIAQIVTLGDLIGTATADTEGSGIWDEWTVRAANVHTIDVVLTVEWGVAGDDFEIDVPFKAGFVDVIVDQPMRDGTLITAFAAVTNVIWVAVKRNRVQGGKEA